MRVEKHPIGVLVREDGCVFVPKSRARKEHWTFGSITSQGYATIKYKGKTYKVHRLVAESFLNLDNRSEVDHINRNPSDNRVENLRFVTRSENQRNTRAHDRVDERGGTHKYEDAKKYHHEYQILWRKKHPDYMKNYMANRRKKEVA